MASLQLTFSEAVAGHVRYCQAAGYSSHTLADYQNAFKLFLGSLGQDLPMRQITVVHVEDFMVRVQHEAIAPNGVAPRPARIRRPKTVRNYHIALSSLWTWAMQKSVVDTHVVHAVKPPKVNVEPIQPLSHEQMRRLLAATRFTRAYKNNPLKMNERPTYARDQMILCVLYETMMRADEAVKIKIGDVTFQKPGGSIYVLGKGQKPRVVQFGKTCANAIQGYLLHRPGHKPSDYLIVNQNGGRQTGMQRSTLGRLIARLGERVDIDVYPHLLRITGACHRLNNGLNPAELQHLMGHSDIKTTMRYVAAAQRNNNAIMSSSPLDNL